MNAELYLFWSNLSLIVFYLFYLMLLKQETFFHLNRVYLLTAVLFSVILPFLNLSDFIALPRMGVMATTLSGITDVSGGLVERADGSFLSTIYWLGVLLSAAWLIFKLIRVNVEMETYEGRAFSFLRTKVIDHNLSHYEVIDAHEEVHIKQLHTLDVLFLEVLGVFFWFNPIIHYYRNSLKFVHEYLADQHAAGLAGSKKQYAMLLFFENFNSTSTLSNSFYNPDMLQARIRMLQRHTSPVRRLWKYTLFAPLVAVILLTCSFSASDFAVNTSQPDQQATFPGGFTAFSTYLLKSTHKVSSKNGSVKVSFIVERSGEITNGKIEESLDQASDREALRVINLSPKWNPALQSGVVVRTAYQIKLNFRSDNQVNN